MILIRDHDKREAQDMTPSKEALDYFSSINIPCVAGSNNSQSRKQEVKHFYDQRFVVMDEPILSEDVMVRFGGFYNCLLIELLHT